jgi:hypothetical protein
MALVACSVCGHQISSLARFCPKCNHSKNNVVNDTSRSVVSASSENYIHEMVAPPNNSHSNDTAVNGELFQLVFKPSMDEMIILEGRTVLVRGIISVSGCYAYLTSKRYALCDASGANIVFQTSNSNIVSIKEGRCLFSRKIIITTGSGEAYQVKCQPHDLWLNALLDPQGAADASRTRRVASLTDSSGTLDWYYEEDGIKIGPIKEKDIIQLIQNNHTVYRNTCVWNAYLTAWKRAEDTILSLYFGENTTSGFDSPGLRSVSASSGRSLFSRIWMIFKKYV